MYSNLVEKQVALPYHARNMCTSWNAYFHTITAFVGLNDTLKNSDPEYYVTSLICIFTYTFIHMPEFGIIWIWTSKSSIENFYEYTEFKICNVILLTDRLYQFSFMQHDVYRFWTYVWNYSKMWTKCIKIKRRFSN